MIKVTFIHHSAFMVELQEHVLLFDYTQGEIPAYDRNKDLYVFASHAHGDHYSPSILQLNAKEVILGFEMEQKNDNIYCLLPHSSKTLHDIKIHTFFSTDEGVAFLIECEGRRIYHAGDLHNWHWPGDTLQEENWMKQHYEEEMRYLAPFHPHIAFVVLDPRLQMYAEEGMDTFFSMVEADIVFPMHLWGDFHFAKQYQKTHQKSNLYLYEHDGSTFLFE